MAGDAASTAVASIAKMNFMDIPPSVAGTASGRTIRGPDVPVILPVHKCYTCKWAALLRRSA
jgi:hypothetical protein